MSRPDFRDGTVDIDDLCNEIRASVRCSESGVVVNVKDVEAAFERLPQPATIFKPDVIDGQGSEAHLTPRLSYSVLFSRKSTPPTVTFDMESKGKRKRDDDI
jgi:hypothetical protein